MISFLRDLGPTGIWNAVIRRMLGVRGFALTAVQICNTSLNNAIVFLPKF
jgi:hypothetical protein